MLDAGALVQCRFCYLCQFWASVFGLLRQLEDGENEGPVSRRRIRMDVHPGGRSKFFKQFTMYLIDIQDVVLVEVES